MTSSIDGGVAVGWPDTAAVRECERVYAAYEAGGWMCGRVTMEPFAGGVLAHERLLVVQGAGEHVDVLRGSDAA
jgi:hypothetical protein